jgi:hypothetical protein
MKKFPRTDSTPVTINHANTVHVPWFQALMHPGRASAYFEANLIISASSVHTQFVA